jgi:hypothetical protein
MMKKNAIRLFLLGLSFTLPFFLSAKTNESELTGTIIYYDGSNEQTHPVNDAFDNNTNTYFNSRYGYRNWIGLDLGEQHIITQIGYAPRMDNDYTDRLTLGVFEGANQADFGDAIPLFIIPGQVSKSLIQQEINCTRGFRYLRFVFPVVQETGKSSYISELKFYGFAGTGSDTQLPVIAGLPAVSIHTVNAEDIVEKEVYIKGMVSVISADGKSIHTDSLNIRGRGNNSWTYPKKPYRMKLHKKASLLGFPAKEKNWTLINNYGDKTLMRNLIAFEISRRMELPYTPAATAVNLFLNGDYRGCYQLCDQIEANKGRVEVEDNGYLLEIDAYAGTEPVWFTSSGNGIPVTIKYPDNDEIVPEQRNYIEQHFNAMVSAVNAGNYTHPTNGFRKYIDTPSFLRRFLAVEFAGNTDSYWSYYVYKKQNDDRFYSSPIWDLDLAFENDWRTYPINSRTGNAWIYASTGSVANGMRALLNRIFTDNNLKIEMEEIYAHYRNNGAIDTTSLLAFVDEMAAKLDASQKLNFTRWQIMNQTVHENPVIHGSYEAEVENVKNYIAERINWLDNKLNYLSVKPDNDSLISVSPADGSGKRIVNIHSYSGRANDAENAYKLLIGESENTNGNRENKWCDNNPNQRLPWVIFSLTDIYHIDRIEFRDGRLMETAANIKNVDEYSILVSTTGTDNDDFEEVFWEKGVENQNIKRANIDRDARYLQFIPVKPDGQSAVRIYGFDIYGILAEKIDRGDLISVGKTILGYHAYQSDRETPANLLDGNIDYTAWIDNEPVETMNDPWAFDRNTGNAWVVIDLEEMYDVNRLVVYDADNWIEGYRIFLSATGNDADWEQVGEAIFSPIQAYSKTITLNEARTAQYVKVEIPQTMQTGQWNRIRELEVYGTKPQTALNPVVSGENISIDGKGWVEVYSLQGTLMHKQPVGEDKTTLSTAGWLPGCYILRFFNQREIKSIKLLMQ